MDSSNLPHSPAQKVGHMRISRKPVKRHQCNQTKDNRQGEEDSNVNDIGNNGSDTEQANGNSNDKQRQANADEVGLGQLHKRELQERVARDMQAHTASRRPEISTNPGSNVKQIHISNAQPRGLSH